VRYKNFKWPFEDKDLLYTLKKEICAYLNSSGGYIFLGVRDQDRMVIGLDLLRKEMDEMKLFFNHMVEGFDPAVKLE
jgi:predicted HTH transcriptional regulator